MTTETTKGRKPTHDVLYVKEEGEKPSWSNHGAGWLHQDQHGMNLIIDSIPVNFNGRLVVKVRKEKTASEEAK